MPNHIRDGTRAQEMRVLISYGPQSESIRELQRRVALF